MHAIVVELDLDDEPLWEELVCKALSNFSITMKEGNKVCREKEVLLILDFSFKQLPTQRFHEDQPLPDNDPIPDHQDDHLDDHPDDHQEEFKKKNRKKLACVKTRKKEENKEKGPTKLEKTELNRSSDAFCLRSKILEIPQDPVLEVGAHTDSRSERDSDDSGFEEEEEEEDNKEMEKIGLSPFLGLAVGSMLVGTSVGCCQTR